MPYLSERAAANFERDGYVVDASRTRKVLGERGYKTYAFTKYEYDRLTSYRVDHVESGKCIGWVEPIVIRDEVDWRGRRHPVQRGWAIHKLGKSGHVLMKTARGEKFATVVAAAHALADHYEEM